MRARFLKEVAFLGLPSGPGPLDPVTDADLTALPAPARRYLAFMGVVGRRGRMLIELLDLWTIQDAAGPEYDTGEFVTYLTDAVLVAP